MENQSSSRRKSYIPALGYSWMTWAYDLAIRWTMPEKLFRSQLIEHLAPGDDEIILEFGSGTGANLILGHERNPGTEFRGLEIDPAVHYIAARKLQSKEIDIRLDLYDGALLPYANSSFDKVFSSLVFHQLDRETKLACLREIYRVLKPGGLLIIGDWGKAKSRWMRIAFYTVQLLDGFASTKDNVEGMLPEYIKQAGFRNAAETGYINTKIGSFCYYRAEK